MPEDLPEGVSTIPPLRDRHVCRECDRLGRPSAADFLASEPLSFRRFHEQFPPVLARVSELKFGADGALRPEFSLTGYQSALHLLFARPGHFVRAFLFGSC